MKMNRTELKIVQYDFSCISNRLLRANYQDYEQVLMKFIRHLEDTEIIFDFIKDCITQFDVETEVNEVANSFGRLMFDLGDDNEEEISRIYQILKHICDNNFDVSRGIAHSYSTSKKFQDMIRSFNERVVLVFISHIENYLTKIGIGMGMDETTKYVITVSGGQVNLANDNSQISATQNNGIDFSQFETIRTAILDSMGDEQTREEKEQIEETLVAIKEELQKSAPKKGVMTTMINGIKVINGSASFLKNMKSLYTFVEGLMATGVV